jgi:hypothetical protein
MEKERDIERPRMPSNRAAEGNDGSDVSHTDQSALGDTAATPPNVPSPADSGLRQEHSQGSEEVGRRNGSPDSQVAARHRAVGADDKGKPTTTAEIRSTPDIPLYRRLTDWMGVHIHPMNINEDIFMHGR